MLRPLGIALVLTPIIPGVGFPHGRVAFEQPSVFAEVVLEANSPQGGLMKTTSNFFIQIPASAGKPLARLEIQQLPSIETVDLLPQGLRGGDRPLGQNVITGRLQFCRNSNFC
ncbi:hypothetical protein [Thermosynechococcus vestitus]|uniref:Tll0047 protein n=1 Tax=Thermosynechococcus vestitus (strain NIES-2133 / IAM M-273 / BP-1) TaxID=197221 RepID=Q8DMR4_THEVB|nr:hypothetical protein [Thermosynechococcus vestitus]BAC07600.1 tll0047 [Thermosynechococcus vestitus BP-1]